MVADALNYLCHVNVEVWHKMYIQVFVPSENLARKELFKITSLTLKHSYAGDLPNATEATLGNVA